MSKLRKRSKLFEYPNRTFAYLQNDGDPKAPTVCTLRIVSSPLEIVVDGPVTTVAVYKLDKVVTVNTIEAWMDGLLKQVDG